MAEQPDELKEETPGGSTPIFTYDHTKPQVDYPPSDLREGWREALEAHLRAYLGPCATVYHEIVSTTVHLDLYIYAPTEARPYFTIVTSGISARPLHVPEGAEEFGRLELMLYLPADWNFDFKAGGEAAWWPFRLLKFLGRFVHEYRTFLAPGHTVAESDPPEPYMNNTLLSMALLLSPVLEEEGFDQLAIEGTPCRFLWVWPITNDEGRLKIKVGLQALLGRLVDAGVSPIIDPSRPCAVTGKRPAL